MKKNEIERLPVAEHRKNNELKFRLFFESAPEAILIMDADTGNIINFNNSALKLLKYTSAKLFKKSFKDISAPHQLSGISTIEEASELFMATGKWQKPVFEWLVTDSAGTDFTCEMRFTKVAGMENYIYASFSNITERKMLEAEKDQIIAGLKQRNKDLDQFANLISHNLRGPIGNITAAAMIINHRTLTEEKKIDFIKGIERSALKVDEVLKDFHVIMQAKKELESQKETAKFSDILNDVKASLSEQIILAKPVIYADFSEINEFITIKSYLHSVFYNLISNSIKYRRIGIVPCIEIKSRKTDHKIELIFRDNGMGIDLKTHGEKVFGLYKRFHLNVEGKGMGLYMVKTQIESMGGSISIQSEVDKGTRFKIQFTA
ncbi:MAG: domain S-box [Sphingobacteriales bacterium]|nr:domain S-box [Sphingobacteriales bacterium]